MSEGLNVPPLTFEEGEIGVSFLVSLSSEVRGGAFGQDGHIGGGGLRSLM